MEQGGVFVTVLKCPILRLRQEPPRPCRRNSHDSSADKVVGKIMLFGQRGEFFSIDEDLKFGFVGEMRGMRQGELLKKFPLEPLKTFGAGDHEAEWWRTLTEVKCGHSHVRKRQVPLNWRIAPILPARFAPMFPLRTEGKMLVENTRINPNLKSSFIETDSSYQTTLSTEELWGSSASGSRRFPTRENVGALERSNKNPLAPQGQPRSLNIPLSPENPFFSNL